MLPWVWSSLCILAGLGCASSTSNQSGQPAGKAKGDMENKTASASVTLNKLVELDKGYGNRLAFGPDGHHWVTATAREFHLWRDHAIETSVTTEVPIQELMFRPGGHELALCPQRYDLDKGTFVSVPPISEQLVAGLGDPPPSDRFGIAACAEAADGETVVVAARYAPSREYEAVDTYHGPHERVLLLRGATRTFQAALYEGNQEIRALAVSKTHVVGGGRTIQVWDRATGKRVAELARHTVVVRVIAFSSDEQMLYAVGADGLMTAWSTTQWTLVAAWQAHDRDVRALAVHLHQPLLVTGDNNGKLRLWSTDQPGQMLDEQSLAGPIESVAFDEARDRLGAAVRGFPAHIGIFELVRAAPPGP